MLTSPRGISTLLLSFVLFAASSQGGEHKPQADAIGFREVSNKGWNVELRKANL